MRGDEVARGVAVLDVGEPGVARPARCGLRGAGAEVELAELERQTVALRQIADRLSDRPTIRLNSMIRVCDYERELSLGCERVHQVEQRHGVETAGHGQHGAARRGEEPGPIEVCAQPREQRGHTDNDILPACGRTRPTSYCATSRHPSSRSPRSGPGSATA